MTIAHASALVTAEQENVATESQFRASNGFTSDVEKTKDDPAPFCDASTVRRAQASDSGEASDATVSGAPVSCTFG